MRSRWTLECCGNSLPSGVQSLAQKRRGVVTVCRSGDDPERDALGVNGHTQRLRRSLRDAAIDGHLRAFEADDSVVSFERHLFECLHRFGLYPLVASSAQCGGRTRLVGDPFVSTIEHLNSHELLEDHSIRYARPMTAEKVIGLRSWQQCPELLPDGLDDAWWDGGHEYVPCSGSLDNSPDDGTSRAQFSWGTSPYWRKLLG